MRAIPDKKATGMKTVAIIQARMGSTRLPGKVMMPLLGKPMVWHVARRVCEAQLVDQVIVAIPLKDMTTPLLNACEGLGGKTIALGHNQNDLINRYYQIASICGADTIVRVPADNPCVDPDNIDEIVSYYHSLKQPIGDWLVSNLDRNIVGSGYAGGLGAEVYSMWFLQWLFQNVFDPVQREHPHKWAVDRGRVKTPVAYGHLRRPELRFDVNTNEDFDNARMLYDCLGPNFRSKELIEFVSSPSRRQNFLTM